MTGAGAAPPAAGKEELLSPRLGGAERGAGPHHVSGHVWERTVCKHRPALVCVRCGYVLKLSMLRPTRDCRPVTP